MKTIKVILILIVCFTSISLTPPADYWVYKNHSSLSKDGITFMVLSYGIRREGYNGYIKWRLVNKTNTEIHDLQINNRVYIMSNGDSISLPPLSFLKKTIGPGEENTTTPDKINPDSYQTDKLTVKSVKVNVPEIKVRFKPGGKHHEWNSLGEVSVE